MTKLLKNKHGYTLIETAIVLVIVGLLVGAMSSIYTVYSRHKEFDTTESVVKKASNALIAYANMYGRYPCPAQANIKRGQQGYGMELCAPNNDPTNPIPASGNCFEYNTALNTLTEGVCVEESTSAVTDKRILRGVLPFKALNLSEDETIDQYGSRLTYAVTYSMTNEDTFSIEPGKSGAIILVDDNDNVITKAAHFYVFSAGKDKAGAYTRGGVLSSPCPALPSKENENCDVSVGDGIYRNAQKSDKQGKDFYDDQGYYRAQLGVQEWEYVSDTSADIVNKTPGKLVIGAPPSVDLSTASKVEVKGDVYSDGGVVMADEICDPTAKHTDTRPECFRPEVIGGQLAENEGLKCPRDDPDGHGRYLVGIKHGRAICEDEIYSSCPNGTFVKEIKSDGTIVCTNPPKASCSSEEVEDCGEVKSLGVAVHGDCETLYFGTCYMKATPESDFVKEECVRHKRKYCCDDGKWKENYFSWWWYGTGNKRSCECRESFKTVDGDCGVGYTGNTKIIRKISCPSGKTSDYSSLSRDECVCDPGAIKDEKEYCSKGLTGKPKKRYIMRCPGGWEYQGPSPDSEPCVCPDNDDDVHSYDCPEGFEGTVTERKTWICPDGVGGTTAGYWSSVVKTNDCKCDDSYVETEQRGCPSGYTGQENWERKWICDDNSAGHFAEWKKVSDNCKIIPVHECTWQSTSDPTPVKEGKGKPLGHKCKCGKEFTQIGCYTGSGTSFQQYYTCECK